MKTYIPKLKRIFACAWCPQDTHVALKENQVHTHGICLKHKLELILSIQANYQLKTA